MSAKNNRGATRDADAALDLVLRAMAAEIHRVYSMDDGWGPSELVPLLAARCAYDAMLAARENGGS